MKILRCNGTLQRAHVRVRELSTTLVVIITIIFNENIIKGLYLARINKH